MGWPGGGPAVWVNDEVNCRHVVVGGYGFAWWEGTKVMLAPFRDYETHPSRAYQNYSTWDDVHVYRSRDVSRSSIVRFVRSGLLPVQGKLA